MKYLNYIIYLPGLAGKFTQFLTSLHPITRPHLPINVASTDVSTERLDLCSYKDLYTRYRTWENHHLTFGALLTDKSFNEFLESNYTHYNYCNHPHEFYLAPFRIRQGRSPNIQVHTDPYVCNMLQNKIPQADCQIRYLQMAISTKYQSVIDEFKVKNGNFPSVRPDEVANNSQFTLDYDPYIINLDNYFIGESNFLDEYTKLMNYLEIPAQVDLALQLYRGWIESRNSNP